MHVLSMKIIDQANRAGYEIDRLDLELTVTKAMSEFDRQDLAAMVDFFVWNNQPPSYIMAQVGHDLIGFKQRYDKAPAADFFCPRSRQFKAILERWKASHEQASADQSAPRRSV